MTAATGFSTILTEEQVKAALANCTRAEREMLNRFAAAGEVQQAAQVLELKHEFPAAQIVEEPRDDKHTRLILVGRGVARSDSESKAAADEGIARADANAPEEWKARALEAVERVCRTKAVFTPDDIWELVEKPPTPQALGPVMQRARSLEWCAPTGAFVPSQIPSQHQNPIREWKSLLVPDDSQVVPADDELPKPAADPAPDDDEIGTLL
jgi:hypothetical protein